MLCMQNILKKYFVKEVMKHNQTVCFNIKTSWHAISRMYNECGQKFGITTAMGYVLLNIDINGTPATRIGPILGMESRSLSRMLKSLEENDLIYRKQDEQDKRLYKIFLTEKGKDKRELAKKIVKKFNNAVREQVSDHKLDIFFEVIEKINNIIDQKKNTEITF
jgi:MarR family transcriptional regulator, organic hydroperoxide resistance regulator